MQSRYNLKPTLQITSDVLQDHHPAILLVEELWEPVGCRAWMITDAVHRCYSASLPQPWGGYLA